MNYSELKTAIANFAKRDEADVGTFVSMAHARICASLETPDALTRIDLVGPPVGVGGSQYAWPLPDDGLRLREVYDNGRPLASTNLTDLAQYRGSSPWGYAVEGQTVLVGPGPGTISISYHKRLPELAADDDTNWALTNYPQLYIYGSLAHLHEYVQDDEQTAMCQQLYSLASELAAQQIETLKAGGSPVIRSA